MKRGRKVNGQHHVPLLRRETQYGAYILHAGIIDQYVGCAQRSSNAFDHGHKTRAISKVAFEVLHMYIVTLAQGLDHMLTVIGLAKAQIEREAWRERVGQAL